MIENKLRHKIFEIDFDGLKFKYEYDFGWYKKKVHNITPRSSGDALESLQNQFPEKIVTLFIGAKNCATI